MYVRNIPYPVVAADHVATQSAQEIAQHTRSQRFNTADHSRYEILRMLPESASFKHFTPPWDPYGYTLWQPLIARNQRMTESHIVSIPSFLYEDMMRCHAAWITTGKIEGHILEDIVETLKSTMSGKLLAPLLDGKKQWFIRLDQMSPKDSPLGGDIPSSTFADVIVKLCSSMRAYGCLQRMKQVAEENDMELAVKLILNPWNESMDPAKEFRVFVPPPAARRISKPTVSDFRISAISQYEWHKAFQVPYNLSLDQVADKVYVGALGLMPILVAYIAMQLDAKVAKTLLESGFTFDVLLLEDGRLQLVEINPFGAMSPCGACLFNWVLDATVLYGLDPMQFAVTVDG
ncbi:hypothetical protein FB567DRAFT_510478 [Paraphoma chrysanthemicola]|uniref:Cell division cycle protein 123 n=1 Tax=Paraphoma chrysanthemicola TaxID=798071 RepID=A0A8K0W3F6_9PLEO|nr:hypothetical protein FB567DRAFT_510478 [Paraphoma chrysanthemicola]